MPYKLYILKSMGEAVKLPSDKFSKINTTLDGFLLSFYFHPNGGAPNGTKIAYQFFYSNQFNFNGPKGDLNDGYYKETEALLYINSVQGTQVFYAEAPSPNSMRGEHQMTFINRKAQIGEQVEVESLAFDDPYKIGEYYEATFNIVDAGNGYPKNDYKKRNGGIDFPKSIPGGGNGFVSYNYQTGPNFLFGTDIEKGLYFFHKLNYSDKIVEWTILGHHFNRKYDEGMTKIVYRLKEICIEILPILTSNITSIDNVGFGSANESILTDTIDQLIFKLKKSWAMYEPYNSDPGYELVLPSPPDYKILEEFYSKITNFFIFIFYRKNDIMLLSPTEKIDFLIEILPSNILSIVDIQVLINRLHEIIKKAKPTPEDRLTVLGIIQAIKPEDANYFLEQLRDLNVTNIDDKKVSLFEGIYVKATKNVKWFDTTHRKQLMQSLLLIWYASDFNPDNIYDFSNNAELTEPIHNIYKDKIQWIQYESKKSWGWFDDNMDFTFNQNLLNGERLISYNTNEIWGFPSFGAYPIYQPVSIRQFDEGDIAVKIPSLFFQEGGTTVDTAMIPLFFLKHIDDCGDEEDYWTGVSLAFDIALTFTGIGNLTKLRHLRHITKLGRLAIGKTITTSERVLALELASGLAGLVELTTATASLILTYYTNGCSVYINGVNQTIDDNNSDGKNPPIPAPPSGKEWCETLDKWLFFAELAAGGADAMASLMLRKTSKKLIDDGVPIDFPMNAATIISEFAGDSASFLSQFRLARRNKLKQRLLESYLNTNKWKNGVQVEPRKFIAEYNDIELDELIDLGTNNGFSFNVIQDFIFIGGRQAKPISFVQLKGEMNYFKNVTLENGYPARFFGLTEFKDTFKSRVVGILNQADYPSSCEIFVQGSSLRRIDPGDIDLAIFIPEIDLKAFLQLKESQFISHNKIMFVKDEAPRKLRLYREQINDGIKRGMLPSYYFKKTNGIDISKCPGYEQNGIYDGIANFVHPPPANDHTIAFTIIIKNGLMDVGPYLKLK
jgi:hypothetical protein